jgi:hypothetical protein
MTNKTQAKYSNTLDSKDSKPAPSNSYLSFKNAPISHNSFITFRGGNEVSDHNLKEFDEISNALSFNGNFGFGVKEEIQDNDAIKCFDVPLKKFEEVIAEDVDGEHNENDKDTTPSLYKPSTPETMIDKYQLEINLNNKPKVIELDIQSQDSPFKKYGLVKLVSVLLINI